MPTNKTYETSQAYQDKLGAFLELKESRRVQQEAQDAAILKKRHDDIAASFHERCQRVRQWSSESKRRHAEDRNLFASRRQHEAELQQQHEERLARIRSIHHDSVVMETQAAIATLEANIRRLGLDEAKPVTGPTSAAKQPTIDPLAANRAAVTEIRRRKNIDVAARREKLQRQYVAQQQQMLASQDVVQKQMIDGVVAQSAAALAADREASLAARRQRVVQTWDAQLSHVLHEGDKARRLAAFHRHDEAFAVVAAKQRVATNEAFNQVRSVHREQEEAQSAKKHAANTEYFGVLVREVVSLATDVASRNYVQLADGTVLRRLNPPTPSEWRDMKDAHLSAKSIHDAIATKREVAARQVAMSNASPRNKRTSSINMGAFGGSLTLPSTPPMLVGSGAGSPSSSAASILDLMNAPPPTLFPVPEDADSEAAEVALESLVALDSSCMRETVDGAVRAVYGESRALLASAHNTKCSELIAQAQSKSTASGAWWTNVLNDLPPAAMFVLGDPLSGVKLMSDLRFVSEGVEQDSLLTPEKLSVAVAAATAIASQAAAAAEALNVASASSPSPPAGGKAAPSPSKPAPPSKASPAGAPPRPSDVALPAPSQPQGNTNSSSGGGVATAVSSSILAATLAKLVVKHHRKQIEALVKKDNASGYPPSLVLVDFPVDDDVFVSELNGCLEREVEEDEKSWAPAKLILGQDSTSQHHGGGGVGTHRSSLAGGQGGTNPNTPHGSIQNQGGPPVLVSPPHSNHGGSVHHESPGGRHHAPPAFSAAAGKHQAALVAMQASAMFYPAVRISTVSLTLTLPNLLERYQSAVRLSAGGGGGGTWHHATWYPAPAAVALPDAAGLSASQSQLRNLNGCSGIAGLSESAQPPWSGMSAVQIDEYVTSKGAAWATTMSHWVHTMGTAHRRPPLPSTATALGSSMGSTYGSVLASSVTPPPPVAAARHSRVLHFLSEISVDDMSPCDPHDVVAQLLAQLTRSTAQRDAMNESSLMLPLLAPMSMGTMSIPEASFEELLLAQRLYEQEGGRWAVDDVIAASHRKHAAAFGEAADTGAPDSDELKRAGLPHAIAQRLDDSKEAMRLALRAFRELETESARCLHHSYLHVLQLLNTDAYSTTAATFQTRLRELQATSGSGAAAVSETKQDQLYWELCDDEMTRLRHTTGGSIGMLSSTLRQLQFLQLRTLIDVVQLLCEQVTMLVVASLLEAQRRRRVAADDDATAAASWATSTAEQICASCFATTWKFHSVEDALLQNLLTSVHENGVALHDSIWHLCQQMAVDAQRSVASALRAVTRCGLEDSGAGEAVEALWTETESNALGATLGQLAQLVLLGQDDGSDGHQAAPQFVGRVTQCICAPMVKHEAVRKHLSLGAASWLSYLFQEASKLRKALDRLPTIIRPLTFDELRKTEVDASITDVTQRTATRSLCVSTGQLEHLLSSFAASIGWWHRGKADTEAARGSSSSSSSGVAGAALMVDRKGFVHGMLAAQASTLHLHLPSPVLEEVVAPLLQLTCSGATKEWVSGLTGENHRSLFLPAWWIASGQWCCNNVKSESTAAGHCFTLDALQQMFDEMQVDELDLTVWLAQLVSGALDVRFLTREGLRYFALDTSRIAQPNVLQSRTLMEDLDAIRRLPDTRSSSTVPFHKLRWWPFFPSLVSNVALMEARMAQVLTQLNVVFYTAYSLDRRTGLLVTAGGSSGSKYGAGGDTAYLRIVRWVLATAAPSGPSALLEMAFAVAASLRGSLLTKMDEVRPQPITVPHSKASIAVHIVVSVLRAVYPLWTEDQLRLFVLLTMPPSKNKPQQSSPNGDEEAEEWTGPLSTRYVEASFAALNASHLGTSWVTKYCRNVTVPNKEPLFL